jgi:O-glycosyl hydrolase
VSVLDDTGKPNNGPFEANRTMITLDSATRAPVEHFDFFMYGQFMKFIRRGAVRVESSAGTANLANVAFRNPDGEVVLVVVNASTDEQAIAISCTGRWVSAQLPAKSVATYQWIER